MCPVKRTWLLSTKQRFIAYLVKSNKPFLTLLNVWFTAHLCPASPSERLEVGQIPSQWRPFPLSVQCDTHSRVGLALRFILAPRPHPRVTLQGTDCPSSTHLPHPTLEVF